MLIVVQLLICQMGTSTLIMYDVHTRDHDHIVTPDEASQLGRPDPAGREKTRLPGQEFHFDYVLGYHPNERWELGAIGYFYQQVTHDEISGKDVNDRRGRVLSLGPGVKYNFNGLSLIGKVDFETAVRNRPQGVSGFLVNQWGQTRLILFVGGLRLR